MYSKDNSQKGAPLDFKLPSRFKFGDRVTVFFGSAGMIKNCTIIKIHFTESKVFYDVEVKWRSTAESAVWTDRLYNLDSTNVYPAEDFATLTLSSTEKQKQSNFTVRLKVHVEKCMKKSGMTDAFFKNTLLLNREEIRERFFEVLGEGAVEALKVEDCVEKYIPKQKD